jgi:hypothetical protein
MMQWLPVTDPLRVAEDPECGYGRPEGFVRLMMMLVFAEPLT